MYVSILTIARVTRLGEFTQIEMFLGNLIKFKITQILAFFPPKNLCYEIKQNTVWAFFSHWHRVSLTTGLPDFSWYSIPKQGKIYQRTNKYIKKAIKYIK
jgi:hypothetical protein